MGTLADRHPTLLTICKVVEEPGGQAVSIERRTVELSGREAILVESLMQIRRRRQANRRRPVEGGLAELR